MYGRQRCLRSLFSPSGHQIVKPSENDGINDRKGYLGAYAAAEERLRALEVVDKSTPQSLAFEFAASVLNRRDTRVLERADHRARTAAIDSQ